MSENHNDQTADVEPIRFVSVDHLLEVLIADYESLSKTEVDGIEWPNHGCYFSRRILGLAKLGKDFEAMRSAVQEVFDKRFPVACVTLTSLEVVVVVANRYSEHAPASLHSY